MDDMRRKIEALPEWPQNKWTGDDHVERYRQLLDYVAGERSALLARLGLAREWISTTHQPDCAAARSMEFWPVIPVDPCTCGRDALLKAMEGPK